MQIIMQFICAMRHTDESKTLRDNICRK